MPTPITVEDLLREARSTIVRLSPDEAAEAHRAGAQLIDIRPDEQRRRDGEIPGARVVARNVFEWRCDPRSEWRDPAVADLAHRLIVICDEGFQSSLTAAMLTRFGFTEAGDVIGGFQAWRAAGLPVSTPD